MSAEDHHQTASYGARRSGVMYRSEQHELIQQGKIKRCNSYGYKDIRSLFGRKYNQSVLQMLKYAHEEGYIDKLDINNFKGPSYGR